MAKYKGIKYNFSGKWDDVSNVLRQFSVADALKRINQESIKTEINPNKSKIKEKTYHPNTLDKSEARIWYILIMIFGAITTAPLLVWIGASLWYFGKDRP